MDKTNESSIGEHGTHFYASDLSDCPCLAAFGVIPTMDLVTKLRETAIVDHKLLFALLYRRPVQLPDHGATSELLRIANIVALAEYYELLPAVAGDLTKLLLDVPSLWKEVATKPLFFLALAKKLRCQVLFADAVRHIAGSGGYRSAVAHGMLTEEENAPIVRLTVEQKDGEARLLKVLRQMSLSFYRAHSDRSKKHQGPTVATTFLLATSGVKSMEEKCRWLAGSIFREWLDFQLTETDHWSYIQYALDGKGDIKAG